MHPEMYDFTNEWALQQQEEEFMRNNPHGYGGYGYHQWQPSYHGGYYHHHHHHPHHHHPHHHYHPWMYGYGHQGGWGSQGQWGHGWSGQGGGWGQ